MGAVALSIYSRAGRPSLIAFFLTLVPQFMRPEAGSLALQSLVLGSMLALITAAWSGFVWS